MVKKPGLIMTDFKCADFDADVNNYGARGTQCPMGYGCCGGQCIDLSSTTEHCGLYEL